MLDQPLAHRLVRATPGHAAPTIERLVAEAILRRFGLDPVDRLARALTYRSDVRRRSRAKPPMPSSASDAGWGTATP